MSLADLFASPVATTAGRRVEFHEPLPAQRRVTPARLAQLRAARAVQPPLLGEANGAAKLTEKQVRQIRAQRAEGERPSILARRYGVDRTLIWYIVTRRIWGHV